MDTNLVNAVSKVDSAFMFIFGVSALILLLITAVTIYFLFRYSKKRNPVPTEIDGNLTAEIIWTVIPIIIVGAMFWYGWTGYKALRDAPADSYNIKVTARMWSWKFEYPNGKTSEKLYVPENTPVKLDMTSVDVIHSFYVAAFRIKMDTVPGMQTYTWFNSGKPGEEYDIQCAEYCGVRHAYMRSKVVVMPKAEFEEWLNGAGDETAQASEGEALLQKYGCLDCHSLDGSELVGPTLKDLYGRDAVVVEGGAEKTVKADDAYIRESVYEPAKQLVKGFEDMMPSFTDQMPEEDFVKILKYLKGEEKAEKPGAAGAKIAEDQGCMGCHSDDGSIVVGPSFKGLMDSKLTAVKDGKKVELTANVEYIISSIKNPQDYIVEGFDDSMPPYDSLTDDEIKALIEYISTLK